MRRAVLNIVSNILKESIRGKLFWSLVGCIIIFLGFSVYISSLSLGTPARFILNAGMVGISLVSLAVTVLFGLYSIYEEKNRCELYVILNRIKRPVYLMGRFLGAVIIQTIYAVIMSVSIFIITWYFGNIAPFEIFAATFWSILEFSLLIAIGLFFYSMNIGFTLNAMLLIAIFVIGHSTKEAILSFRALGQFGSELHLYLVKMICIVLPNFDFLDFRLALIHHEPIPSGSILISAGYWISYLTGVLIITSVVMKKKDI